MSGATIVTRCRAASLTNSSRWPFSATATVDLNTSRADRPMAVARVFALARLRTTCKRITSELNRRCDRAVGMRCLR